jgi:hypothetical protein
VIAQQAQVMLKVERSGTSINEILAGRAVPRVELTEEDVRDALIDPHELFRDHVYGCFIDDPTGLELLDVLPVDNIMIETDYPHPDCTFPNSRSIAAEALGGASADVREKILWRNAVRLFDFTPALPAGAASSS